MEKTIEQRTNDQIVMDIGNQFIAISRLQAQLAAAQDEIAALKAELNTAKDGPAVT